MKNCNVPKPMNRSPPPNPHKKPLRDRISGLAGFTELTSNAWPGDASGEIEAHSSKTIQMHSRTRGARITTPSNLMTVARYRRLMLDKGVIPAAGGSWSRPAGRPEGRPLLRCGASASVVSGFSRTLSNRLVLHRMLEAIDHEDGDRPLPRPQNDFHHDRRPPLRTRSISARSAPSSSSVQRSCLTRAVTICPREPPKKVRR
jgi:hypothetical protein